MLHWTFLWLSLEFENKIWNWTEIQSGLSDHKISELVKIAWLASPQVRFHNSVYNCTQNFIKTDKSPMIIDNMVMINRAMTTMSLYLNLFRTRIMRGQVQQYDVQRMGDEQCSINTALVPFHEKLFIILTL